MKVCAWSRPARSWYCNATVQGTSLVLGGVCRQIVITAWRVSLSFLIASTAVPSCALTHGPYAPKNVLPSSENLAMFLLYGAIVRTSFRPSRTQSHSATAYG